MHPCRRKGETLATFGFRGPNTHSFVAFGFAFTGKMLLCDGKRGRSSETTATEAIGLRIGKIRTFFDKISGQAVASHGILGFSPLVLRIHEAGCCDHFGLKLSIRQGTPPPAFLANGGGIGAQGENYRNKPNRQGPERGVSWATFVALCFVSSPQAVLKPSDFPSRFLQWGWCFLGSCVCADQAHLNGAFQTPRI